MLTSLGIVIGIATVMLVLSAGEGFRSYINAQVETYGTNFVTIETRVPPTTKAREEGQTSGNDISSSSASQAVAITTLTSRDVDAIKRIDGLANAYGAVIGQKVVSYQNVSKNSFIFGADPARFEIDQGTIARGRPYTEQENRALGQVALLGADIANDLFGASDPIGKYIRVGNLNFMVIGVYARRGSFGFSNDDQQVFVPLTTAQKKLLGIDHLFYIVGQTRDKDIAPAVATDIRVILRQNHGITDPDKDDFIVHTQEEGMEIFDTVLSGVTLLLVAIAAISLLVGGVGIMNIMYVAVTERIGEIGLKIAFGATKQDILWSFLIESVLLTIGGGAAGVVLGTGLGAVIAKIASAYGFAWDFIVPIPGIMLSVGIAGAIGIAFGVFPARRAAELDPIEALRSEQ